MIVLGIDAGVHGGTAIIETTDAVATLINAWDIPVIGSGAKERVDVAAVRNWVQLHRPALGLIERAQAMPRQGSSSGFKYGRATGALESAIVLAMSRWKSSSPVPGKNTGTCRGRTKRLRDNGRCHYSRRHTHCSRANAITVAPKRRCLRSMGFIIHEQRSTGANDASYD